MKKNVNHHFGNTDTALSLFRRSWKFIELNTLFNEIKCQLDKNLTQTSLNQPNLTLTYNYLNLVCPEDSILDVIQGKVEAPDVVRHTREKLQLHIFDFYLITLYESISFR